MRTSASPTEHPAGGTALDPTRWVDRHGDYLFRYAFGRVRRSEAAEELVQEALLAAWRGRANFRGRASERSWLTAILKRKVIDWLRAAVRDRKRQQETADDSWADKLFTSGGKWKSGPEEWLSDTPESGVEREEFWAAVNGCTQKLPTRLRDVFVLWHLEEQSSDDVCRAAGVTTNNLWVMLHRARLRMWRCLSRAWYDIDPDDRSTTGGPVVITCRRAAEWTSRELDERLSAGRRFALGFHRLVCVQCRRFRDQLAAVDAAAGELVAEGVVGSIGLPDAAKERIAQVLKEVGG